MFSFIRVRVKSAMTPDYKMAGNVQSVPVKIVLQSRENVWKTPLYLDTRDNSDCPRATTVEQIIQILCLMFDIYLQDLL